MDQALAVPRVAVTRATVVLGATILGTAAGLVLEGSGGADRIRNPFLPMIVFTGLLTAVLGYLVARRHGGHPVARLLQGCGALTAVVALTGGHANAALFGPLPEAGAALTLWLSRWLWVPLAAVSLGLLLAYPDGRLPGPRWWPAVVVAVGGYLAFTVLFATMPFTESVWRDVPVSNPVGPLPPAVADALWIVTPAWYVAGAAVGAAAIVTRYRRADAAARPRLALIVLPAVLLPPALLAGLINEYGGIAEMVVATWLTVAVTIAMLRHRVFDVDVVLNRAVVYGLLAVSLLGAYVSIVVLTSEVVGSRSSWLAGAIAAGVVAVAFGPLLARLRRGVDRLLYGDRAEPDAVAGRLASVGAGRGTLAAAADALRDGLRVPWVRIEVSGDAAEAGEPRTAGRTVPLVRGGEPVGSLIVGVRFDGERTTPADDRALDAAARQLSVTAEALLLARNLAEARERLVGAREDERRRIRRDLHDGLGPALAGITAALEGAEEIARRDPAAAAAVLPAMRAQARIAVDDVRRLVEGLRPPALDDLGLVAAVHQELHRLGALGALDYSLDAPDSLPELPAAVEVAALRITLEAATNALRHSRGTSCRVRLAVEADALRVEVTDDGVGLPTGTTPGIGLESMHERAAEVGGELRVTAAPAGGTTVAAVLPVVPR